MRPDAATTGGARALLSTVTPSRGHRRLAFAIVLASILVFVVLAPLAKVPLLPIAGFIPAYESALVLNDVITAAMLLGQYRILRSRPVAVLATGYLFTASITVAHALSFPGLFAPSGLLGGGPQSTAWIYMFWHGGFACFVVAYALMTDAPASKGPRGRALWPVLAAIAAAIGAATAFALVATRGHDALPAIMQGNRYTLAMMGVVASVWALSLIALLALWRRRARSTMDLWLMVVMCAWLFDIALSAVLNAGRFDVGFYAGRIYGLFAASFVLIVLLVETGRLYAQLAQANAEMHLKAEELQRAHAHLEDEARERKQLIAELTHARGAAELASRAKSAFLATMSHEIRTPMNGVIGMLEVLARSRLSEEQRAHVATIGESAATLLGVIDDILDFSKIEAGRLELDETTVSLPDLVESICSSLNPIAAQRRVMLDVFVSPEVPEHVVTDVVRVRQVLYNLIGNAIKFSGGTMNRRGRVAVSVRVTGAGPVRVAFSIADNGIGMGPETLATLFEPFRQGEVSTTRRFGGTGLGLTICKRLVDLMGGEIALMSAPDEGTTFTVTLPFAVPDAQPRTPALDLLGVEAAIVETRDIPVETLRAYLEHAGASVRLVGDVASAVRSSSGSSGYVVVAGEESAESLSSSLGEWPTLRAVVLRRGGLDVGADGHRGLITLNADALRRSTLLRAVAVAAGRASPVVSYGRAEDLQLVAPAETPTVAEARSRAELILVAEDDSISQKVVLHQLAVLGRAAELARNGAEALHKWRTGSYAMLITDVHMPEMDGYALTQFIRREERGSRMPIIALSANAMRGEAARALSLGFDDYVTKPVQLHVLKAALDKWLPKAAQPADSVGAPQPTPPNGKSVVDITVLEQLIGNDRETVRALLASYLESARNLAGEMRAAWRMHDVRAVAATVHKLKSSSRSVGALTLGNLCEELERVGNEGDKAALATAFAEFEPAFARVEASIAALLEHG